MTNRKYTPSFRTQAQSSEACDPESPPLMREIPDNLLRYTTQISGMTFRNFMLMIHYTQGDLLQSEAEAWVNAVNTVGVMGKGIALQFKRTFPHNFRQYAEACQQHTLTPGTVLAVWDEHPQLGRKLIINFPTKVHWRNPSRYEYIEQSLPALADTLREQEVRSVAIPPLGCGYGGLAWPRVKEMLEAHLASLPLDILLYEPPK